MVDKELLELLLTFDKEDQEEFLQILIFNIYKEEKEND